MRTNNNNGFTIYELLIVFAILTIMLSLGFGGMLNMMYRNEVVNFSRELKGAVELTKMEAIKNNVQSVIAFDVAGDEYTVFVDNGGGDSSNRENGVLDSGEPVIRTGTAPEAVDIYQASFGGEPRIRYNNRGGSHDTGNVSIKNERNHYARVVINSIVGSSKIQVSSNGSDWD